MTDGNTTQTSPKTIVITGAGRGIGRALALKLAATGANLILAARTYMRSKRLLRKHGHRVLMHAQY